MFPRLKGITNIRKVHRPVPKSAPADVESQFRRLGICEADIVVLREVEKQRAREREIKGTRPKSDHPF